MKSKHILIIGIASLSLGILLKSIFDIANLGLTLIAFGVICKTIYIISKVKTGDYKPGKELIFLALGLSLFLIGLHLSNTEEKSNNPIYFIALGLSLKTVFIINFIRKTKKPLN